MSMSDLLQGPLAARHRELGASFAEFGGWLMPVSYAGTVAEHTATRNAVGLFDVSHLGKALVRGPGAAQFVNSALTNDLDRIQPGKAQYTLCCNESGGVIDDLIAYYVGPDEIFLVPNAANTAAVVAALQDAAPAELTITDEHRSYAVLAVQGPRSTDVLDRAGPAHRHGLHGLRRRHPGGRAGAGMPQRLHRRARLRAAAALGFCRGGVRRAAGRREEGRRAVGRPRARATRCAPRWVIRCTVTNSRPTSRRCRPAAAGRSAGRRTPSSVATLCWPKRKRARRGCCEGCGRWVAVCCGRT